MTLSVAWLRTEKSVEELVIATDSRLRAGYAWDCCPKILPLPRSDAAICFAGDTMHAYPLMLQMASTIRNFPKSRSRSPDLFELKGHTRRVFNHMRQFLHDFPHGVAEADPPETYFLLGGFCWRRQRFAIWLLHFDSGIRRFTFRPATLWRGVRGPKLVMFAGDHVPEAKTRLVDLLRLRRKLTVGGFDMEPFEVLRDMIRENRFPEIGGPPQVAKIYKHLNYSSFPVFWPDRASEQVSLDGRPLLEYEGVFSGVLDPDSLEVCH